MRINLTCQNCGKPFTIPPYKLGRAKYCSRPCANSGMLNRPNPKKQKPVNEMRARYFKTRVDGKQVSVHRHLMEQKLGRALLVTEVVHHINGNKLDNRIENLMLMNVSEHSRLENLGKKLTDEHKAKVSKSLVGNQRRRGVPHTEEMKRRHSEIMKRARRLKFWSTNKK